MGSTGRMDMRRLHKLLVALFASLLLQACMSETSEEHLESGRVLLEKRDFQNAIVEFKSALKVDARNAQARALLGEAYYEIEDFESANKELSRALELDATLDKSRVVPTLARTLLYLADYSRLDKLEIDGLDLAGRSTTLAAKALARLYQGDEVVAEEILAAASEEKPVPLFTQLAIARLAIERKEFEKAQKQLNKLVLANMDYAPAWNLIGDIFAAQRQPKKASAAYTTVLKLDPRIFDARLNRVMMYIYQRKFKDARADLQVLERMHRAVSKDHPGVSFARGILLMQAGAYPQARKAFEKAADFSYAFPLAYYYMAVIDLQDGSHERALGEIYRFLKLAPESLAGPKLAARLELEFGGYHTAAQLLEPIVNTYPNDIEALNLLASAKLGLGKGGQGVALLARVARLQPKSPDARTRLGAGYFATGEVELGIEVLQNAVGVDSEFEQAYILLVLNYLREGRVKEAIEEAKAYKNRHPASTTSFNLLGRAYYANKEFDKATWAYTKALELDATDTEARHGLAEIALEHKDYDRARHYYHRVLKYHEDDLQTQLKLAASYALEGNEEIMRNMLQIAIDDHPESTEPLLVLIRYFVAAGRLREAEPLIVQLGNIEAGQPDALATIASYQLATNQYQQAILTLERLQTLRPSVGQYHYMMSKAFAGLGNVEESLRELVKATELNPQHFYTKLALARLAMQQERWGIFEKRLDELKRMAPHNPDVMQLEVVSSRRKGDTQRIAALLWSVYQKLPTSENLLALVDHRMLTGDGTGAVSLLEKWVADNPQDIPARLKLAQVFLQLGNAAQSEAQYRAIIKIDEENLAALNNLAWDLLGSNPAEALRLARRANHLSANSSVQVLDTLAMALLRTGHLEEARRTLVRAVELEPDNLEVRFHEAQVMHAQGNRDATIAALTEILEEDKDFNGRDTARALLDYLNTSG